MVRLPHSFLSLLLIAASAASAQPFVPGEMLVTFPAESPGRAAVERALSSTPPATAALDPVVAALEAGSGVPLRAVQISSGNWTLLSIDSKRLADRLAGRLRSRDRVQAVEVLPGERPARVHVQFSPGSAESEIVARTLTEGPAEPLAGLIRQIGAAYELPLKGEARENRRLDLEVDYRVLTPIVVERLKSLPGVESVQLNYRVGFRSAP